MVKTPYLLDFVYNITHKLTLANDLHPKEKISLFKIIALLISMNQLAINQQFKIANIIKTYGENIGIEQCPSRDTIAKGYCKYWHISDKALYSAIRELLNKGFIIKTQQGKIANGGLDCNLFALAWKQIDYCDGIELDHSYLKRIYNPLNQLINDTS